MPKAIAHSDLDLVQPHFAFYFSMLPNFHPELEGDFYQLLNTHKYAS